MSRRIVPRAGDQVAAVVVALVATRGSRVLQRAVRSAARARRLHALVVVVAARAALQRESFFLRQLF